MSDYVKERIAQIKAEQKESARPKRTAAHGYRRPKRIIANLFDPFDMTWLGGFDCHWSPKDAARGRYSTWISRLKPVLSSQWGLGVRKPITKIQRIY